MPNRVEPIDVTAVMSEKQQLALLKHMGRDLAFKVSAMGFPTVASLVVFSEFLGEFVAQAEADPKSALYIQAARDNVVKFQKDAIPKLRFASHGRPKGTA